MIKVLIADDNSRKVNALLILFESIPQVECDSVSDINSAKVKLTTNQYDLLILDVSIPNRFGDDPNPDNGINFLNNVDRISRINAPYHIIGLTAYPDIKQRFNSAFNEKLWALIIYSDSETLWQHQIKFKIDYLIKSKFSLVHYNDVSFDYDLAIITALHEPELKNVLNIDANWQEIKIPNDHTIYYSGVFADSGKKVKVIAASALQMGMVSTAVLAQKILKNFKPMYISMVGICAAVKGKANYGDIILAETSFDYGSGKVIMSNKKRKFEPDFRSIEVNTYLKELFKHCKTNRLYLDKISSKWLAKKPDTQLNLEIGPLASGSSVVSNTQIIEEIKEHSRKLIGIDMETYALFYVAENCPLPQPKGFFSFKSVTDFADAAKNDDFQAFAAFTSAMFLYQFAIHSLNYE